MAFHKRGHRTGSSAAVLGLGFLALATIASKPSGSFVLPCSFKVPGAATTFSSSDSAVRGYKTLLRSLEQADASVPTSFQKGDKVNGTAKSQTPDGMGLYIDVGASKDAVLQVPKDIGEKLLKKVNLFDLVVKDAGTDDGEVVLTLRTKKKKTTNKDKETTSKSKIKGQNNKDAGEKITLELTPSPLGQSRFELQLDGLKVEQVDFTTGRLVLSMQEAASPEQLQTAAKSSQKRSKADEPKTKLAKTLLPSVDVGESVSGRVVRVNPTSASIRGDDFLNSSHFIWELTAERLSKLRLGEHIEGLVVDVLDNGRKAVGLSHPKVAELLDSRERIRFPPESFAVGQRVDGVVLRNLKTSMHVDIGCETLYGYLLRTDVAAKTPLLHPLEGLIIEEIDAEKRVLRLRQSAEEKGPEVEAAS